MSSKMLSWSIRFAVIACGIAGIFLCIYVYLPLSSFFTTTPDLFVSLTAVLWVILLYGVTVPCYAILVMVWIVSVDVARETVFSGRTAGIIGASSIIILANAAVLLVGTIALCLLDGTTKTGYLMLIPVAAGFALGLFAAVLARYVTKAAVLKEESEGTI